mgnify:CR=1 FL=1
MRKQQQQNHYGNIPVFRLACAVFTMLFYALALLPAVTLASVDLLVVGDWGGMPVKPYTLPGYPLAFYIHLWFSN